VTYYAMPVIVRDRRSGDMGNKVSLMSALRSCTSFAWASFEITPEQYFGWKFV